MHNRIKKVSIYFWMFLSSLICIWWYRDSLRDSPAWMQVTGSIWVLIGSFKLWGHEMYNRIKKLSIYFWIFLSSLICIFCLWWYRTSLNTDLPAWIQAAGSVWVLISSFWISDRAKQAEKRAQKEAVFAVAEATYRTITEIESALSCSEKKLCLPSIKLNEVYEKSVLEGLEQALKPIPLHEVGSPEAVLALLSMQRQLVFLGKALERYKCGIHNDPKISEQLKSAKESYQHRPNGREEYNQLKVKYFSILEQNVLTHVTVLKKDYAVVKETALR